MRYCAYLSLSTGITFQQSKFGQMGEVNFHPYGVSLNQYHSRLYKYQGHNKIACMILHVQKHESSILLWLNEKLNGDLHTARTLVDCSNIFKCNDTDDCNYPQSLSLPQDMDVFPSKCENCHLLYDLSGPLSSVEVSVAISKIHLGVMCDNAHSIWYFLYSPFFLLFKGDIRL